MAALGRTARVGGAMPRGRTERHRAIPTAVAMPIRVAVASMADRSRGTAKCALTRPVTMARPAAMDTAVNGGQGVTSLTPAATPSRRAPAGGRAARRDRSLTPG